MGHIGFLFSLVGKKMIPHDFYLFWGEILSLHDQKKGGVANPMKIFLGKKLNEIVIF
jgi:hypothetical protein